MLSFPLQEEGDCLEGEIVISGQTAARMANRYGWSAGEELMLYAAHGCLHLVGYDDATDAQQDELLAAVVRLGEDPRHHAEIRGAGADPRREGVGCVERRAHAAPSAAQSPDSFIILRRAVRSSVRSCSACSGLLIRRATRPNAPSRSPKALGSAP